MLKQNQVTHWDIMSLNYLKSHRNLTGIFYAFLKRNGKRCGVCVCNVVAISGEISLLCNPVTER